MTTSLAFTPEREEKYKKLLTKYEIRQSALLPVLRMAQEQWGHLSPEVMNFVAYKMDLPPAIVFEVVSFYVMFHQKDMGKYCLQVCNNITCTMMGSEELIKVIKDDLKLGPMQVTEDKTFSYLPVQCLGSCDTAPVVQVNEDYFENQSAEKFRELLKNLKAGNYPKREES
jgi:NADH-quinone oxidoreductase subunit E